MPTQIQEYSKTEAALADLRARYEKVTFDVSTTAGDKAARAARAEVRGYRTALETMRKEIKAPALERCRLIDDEAKRITAELLALEEPIDAQIKAEEQRIATEKAEKARIEQERIDSIRAKIETIRRHADSAVGKSAAEITALSASVASLDIAIDKYAEFADEALQVRSDVSARLDQLHEAAVAHEFEQARIIAERAELEELRKAAAERDRIAAAEREHAEAKAKSEREAAQREIDEQRRAQEAEARRIADEQAAAQAEIDRQRRELEEQQRAAAQAEADRLAAIEREKQEKAEAAAKAKREKEERKLREKFLQEGPSADEIANVIAAHYLVEASVAINWLARHEFSDLLAA